MIGAIILAAWLALNAGFVGGAAFVASRKCGVKLVSAKFLAETATLMVGLSYILYGLQPTLVALGVRP